jgi:hypothetical protein
MEAEQDFCLVITSRPDAIWYWGEGKGHGRPEYRLSPLPTFCPTTYAILATP